MTIKPSLSRDYIVLSTAAWFLCLSMATAFPQQVQAADRNVTSGTQNCYQRYGDAGTCQDQIQANLRATDPSVSKGLRFNNGVTNVLIANYSAEIAPRFIDNNSSDSIFIPQNTSQELAAFLNSTQNSVVKDYAIAPTSYTALPNSYNACTFTPSNYLVKIPHDCSQCVDGFKRLPKASISNPQSISTSYGNTTITSPLLYTYKRTDCSTDPEGNKACVDVTFLQAQQIVFKAQGSAQQAPFFTWNTTSPAKTSILYYTKTGGEPYTQVADCTQTYEPTIPGVCGTASGVETPTKPAANLCKAGTPTTVSGGSGFPWLWSCKDVNGPNSASCSAPYPATIVGTCGTANGVETATAPATGLCSKGTPSAVSGGSGSPWTWTCADIYGTGHASCSAPYPAKINGTCGAANGVVTTVKPTTGLCSTGTPSAVSGGSGSPWTWSCTGIYGGTTASCSAPYLIGTDGQCGPYNTKETVDLPALLCLKGTPSSVSDLGTKWTWSCYGLNGGNTASCYTNKKVVNNQCSFINGREYYFSLPASYSLCTNDPLFGTNKTGNGPWSWDCPGANGGSTAHCSASLAKIDHCYVTLSSVYLEGNNYEALDRFCYWAINIPIVNPANITYFGGYFGKAGAGDYPYPDPYGDGVSSSLINVKSYPFAFPYKGKTMNTVVVGKKARLRLYKGKNFTNGTWIDIHGPAVIYNGKYIPTSKGGMGCDETKPPVGDGGICNWPQVGMCYPYYSNLFDNWTIFRSDEGTDFYPSTRSVTKTDMDAWLNGSSLKITCDP